MCRGESKNGWKGKPEMKISQSQARVEHGSLWLVTSVYICLRACVGIKD